MTAAQEVALSEFLDSRSDSANLSFFASEPARMIGVDAKDIQRALVPLIARGEIGVDRRPYCLDCMSPSDDGGEQHGDLGICINCGESPHGAYVSYRIQRSIGGRRDEPKTPTAAAARASRPVSNQSQSPKDADSVDALIDKIAKRIDRNRATDEPSAFSWWKRLRTIVATIFAALGVLGGLWKAAYEMHFEPTWLQGVDKTISDRVGDHTRSEEKSK